MGGPLWIAAARGGQMLFLSPKYSVKAMKEKCAAVS